MSGFTTVGDIYEVDFRVSKYIGGKWVADPAACGQTAKHFIVAASDVAAVAAVQAYMGQDNTTTRVECHGAVRKVLGNVIIAV